MGKPPRAETARETTPKRFPEVTPDAYVQAVGAGHLVESMMQMQHSIGELKATVNHLNTASDKQSTKLDRISHIIFAAGVVLTIILGIGGFFLNKIWDGVFTLMTSPPQSVQKYQPPPSMPPQPPTNAK
jgi:hypothetical protein